MSAVNRLTGLYPRLLRSARAGGAPRPPSPLRAAGLARHRATFARRRGKAVEPLPHHAEKPKPPPPQPQPQAINAGKDTVIGGAINTEGGAKPTATTTTTTPMTTAPMTTMPTPTPTTTSTTTEDRGAAAGAAATADAATQPESIEPAATTQSAAQSSDASDSLSPEQQTDESSNETVAQGERSGESKPAGPLEAVLHMGPPEEVFKQTPSMSPPPYVHHFDSYSLVKQLQDGGYSQAQSVTAMKAVRKLLSQHLNVAQSSLISKSDVENEHYLFTAACSELSTEIKNNRRLDDEQLRQHRTHLQHEIDILTQSLNQELHTLNDNVRGMFNDRKMAVREEQKAADSAIQQINYKISIMLTSDAKSEIEGVRWVLIRRSVLGILFMAVLTLGTLRYATYVSHERQKEADKSRKEEEERRRSAGRRDHSTDVNAAAILAAS